MVRSINSRSRIPRPQREQFAISNVMTKITHPLSFANEAAKSGTKAALEIPAGFEIYNVTNAQRLAGTRGDGSTPIAAGNHVRVTDQANRVELYLGPINGSGFGNANWLVLENTLLVDIFNGTSGTVTLNGVSIPSSSFDSVGWIKTSQVIPGELSPTDVAFVISEIQGQTLYPRLAVAVFSGGILITQILPPRASVNLEISSL